MRAVLDADAVVIPFGGGTSISGSLEAPRDETRPVISVDLSRLDARARDRPDVAARARAGRRARAATSRGSSTSGAGRSATSPTRSPTRRSAAGSRRARRACSPTATATSPTSRARCAWSRPAGLLGHAPGAGDVDRPERARDGARQRGAARGHHRGDGARPPAARRARVILGYLFPTWEESLAAMRDIAASEAAPSVTRVSDANETRVLVRPSKDPSVLDRLKSAALQDLPQARAKGFDLDEMCLVVHRLRGHRAPRRGAAQADRRIVASHGGCASARRPASSTTRRSSTRPTSATSCSTAATLADVSETAAPWSALGRSTTR